MGESGQNSVRIDKWLWASRFFKTRGLALEAVNGGKVHLNGQRVKPARHVKVGDQLTIHRGPYEFVVDVQGISDKRGPAKVAQQLYQETEASREAREQATEQRRISENQVPRPRKRPNKRDRRHIIRFTRNQG